MTMRTAALIIALLLPVSAAAQEFKVCRIGGRAVWSNRVPCDEIVMGTYHCDFVTGLPHCDPPAKMTLAHSSPPFRVEVTFGGAYEHQGETYWRWMRGGKAFYVTPRFFLRVPQ